ncbi:HU domain-containing protein [Pedobacter cryophilus]|uniref:SPOR domain-containing protein n=1 Tax=Pedobacter cryophilus TaxID=2571271 RepID=A0A4U1BWR8_9SPHI|nr:HU-CCDC81 and SPOR domain-containing protein [Pedobacter cryophilus]TKB96784.1 SPOR domain-containing protein [Pedobacter cryophilus]
MDISPYFAELINAKDHVVVPSLGKFYQKRSAGYYDEGTETFYPPSTKIDFTTEYRHDDKLVQLISQRNNTSLTSAYAILDEYVKDLKTILKSQTVHINNIGELTLDGEKLTLQSDTKSENSKDFFGLTPIDAKALNLSDAEAENYSLAQQALNTAMPNEFDEHKSITLKIVLVFVIAAIIGSLIAVYYLNPNFYQNLYQQLKKETVSEKPVTVNQTPSAQAIQKADSVYNNADIEAKLKAKGFEVEEAKDSTAVSVNQKQIPKKSDIRYEIIIGLYLKKSDALKRVTQLKANGINAYIVEDADGPMIKISGATLYNEAEANQELKRIREQLNPEAFIKPIKPLK